MIKNFVKKYFAGTIYLNAPAVINAVIVLVTLPIVLANVPSADYGKWQFVLALQVWVVAFSADNITRSAKRGIAQGLDGTFIYSFLARAKLLIPISIVILVVSFSLKIAQNSIFSILLIILGGYLLFGYLFQISFYEFLIAKKRFKECFFWQILIYFISMVGATIVAVITKNIIYFVLFQLTSTSLLSFTLWISLVIKENLIGSYKEGKIDKACVPYGLKMIIVDVITATAGKISHFVIGPFLGYTNLAVFSVANKMRDKSAGFLKSLRPLLYADFAKMDRSNLIHMINRHLFKIGSISILLMLLFIVIGWFYIKLFLPHIFHQAITYFAILSLGIPAVMMAIILHTILETHLRYKELTVIGIIPNILKIVLILILGYLEKIIGVCIALVVSTWFTFWFYYFLTIRINIARNIILKYPLLTKLSNF